MFGLHRKHIVGADGKIINKKRTVDHYLKPKKKNVFKPVLIFLGLAILAVIIYLGVNAFTAYSKIIDKNNKSAPFFDNSDPSMLKGEGDGRINILLLGVGGVNHPGGGLTDTIQIISLDPNNKKVAALSIPRDFYVTLDQYGGTKINEVYSIGEKTNNGANLIKETISEILDLPIHYYIKLDFDGFIKIVDEIGGIDIDVPKEISDPYYPDENMIGYSPFYIAAGHQHLNGYTALKYARSRETTSDFDRSARQQQLMIAIKNKVLTLDILVNPSKISALLQILGEHLKTDIQLKELEKIAKLAKEIDTNNIVSKVLDNSPDGPLVSFSNGGYYLKPKSGDYTEIQRIAHEIFTDPYLEEENANIELLNGCSKVGTAKQASDVLISYGYNIVNLDVSSKKYQKTTLYDYSNGKFPYTAKFLSERYNAQVVTQPTTSRSGVDLSLIIGEDYL